MARRKIWQARFDSRCAQCDDEIQEGDDCVYNEDDEVVHANCFDGETYE